MLKEVIAEARKRQQCREMEQAFLAQFGEEVGIWFRMSSGLSSDGVPELRLTHNGQQIAVWCDNDGFWYIEGEALAFDRDDPDVLSDALLVAIDDLAPAVAEQEA